MQAMKADFARRLRQSMRDALDWKDLHSFLAQVDTAFQQGQIDVGAAEDLAVFSIQLSRQLPEVRRRAA